MLVLLALVTFGVKAADSLTMADFVYTNKLSVAGYTGTETLVNFPVLVRINTSLGDFQYSKMRSSKGGDLAFFAADGTRLASEVDTWTTSGTSLVWVKLPSMTQGTKFYMCYRLTDELAALETMVENPNPWGDYVGVWHMRETGGKSTADKPVYVNDSTTNALHGVTASTGKPASVSDGRIGNARHIATDATNKPSTDSGITIDLSDDTKRTVVDNLGTEFTASMWVRVTANFNYFYLISRKNADVYDAWGAQTMSTSDAVGKTRMWAGNDGESNVARPTLDVALAATNQWHKLDFIWKADGSYEVYQDGGNRVSNYLYQRTPAKQGSLNLSIGGGIKNPNTGVKGCRGLNGDMDEVRLKVGALSAEWVKADYDTVNNEQFVTLAPPEVAWVNGSGTAPGVSDVHHDYVAFAGTVTDWSGFPNCSIQCKVWTTSGTEPESWTTITNGLVAADAFSVVYSGLTPETTYSYKLRTAGEGDVVSMPVSGSFTTLAGFAVSWSTATESLGLSETHHDKVVVAGAVTALDGALEVEVQWKCWADGAAAPENWTTIATVLDAAPFEVAVGGLSSATTYNYALRAVANDGEKTTPVNGTFTTEPGLTVLWNESTGLAQVGYDFVKIGGKVRALGDATSCIVQRKIWAEGESEPDWTTFKTGLVKNDVFTDSATNLTAGTTYSYKLRAYGNDDEETEIVEGTFTTKGEEGETIGSLDTHFFNDGTNAYWVANDFERYLPFTVTGYAGTETLTNFPVLVDVRARDTNGFDYDDFYHHGGQDMVFVDEKGHIIPHEIDTWNPNGMSLVWVRLPEMNNGTTFTMCYRSPLLDPPADPGNTFEPYIGVWHMNEKEDGVVDVIDSTTNNLIGETHAKSLAENNGRIGYARRVAQEGGASSSAGRIIIFDHDNILRDVGSVFTYSGWYKLAKNVTDPDWAYLVSRKEEDDSTGWGIQYHDKKDSSTTMRVWAANEGKNKSGFFDIAGIGYKHDEWAYWTFVYSNQTFHAYFKGEELPSTSTNYTLKLPVVNDATASYQHLVIGGMRNGKGALNGYVDEARYSKGVRSPDWIKAEYDSMLQVNKPFVTKGTEVGRGPVSLVPVVVWERGADLPDTILDVSYAYVQFAGTVTFCGAGADTCYIEYQLWADGEVEPTEWKLLLGDAVAGTEFSIPVCGLKQDMPYNFRIRAVNVVDGVRRSTREHSGSFRTNGNINESGDEGELLRVDNRFVHRYGAGTYTFTTPDYVTNISIIVVGGGGAGGYKVGGGGGGGGVFYSLSYAVATSTTYRITVGRGGTAAGNATTASSAGSGEYSFFALDSDPANPLISVPGGGGGGNYSSAGGAGADGASGGGGTFAQRGGLPVSNEVDGVWMLYGNEGGKGNIKGAHGEEKSAAGGGGGGGRDGLPGTSDNWYFGGAGGVGVACSMSGETLYFGAGGGGGYKYYTDGLHHSGPGGGGDGIGGDAADVMNGTPATSGVPNTGAGGGGGSMTLNDDADNTYWQGGDGGDGVVMISYEVHGRDPISEEPRVSLTRCVYDEDTLSASLDYRVYWAGIQNDLDDILVHYSTVGPDDLTNSAAGGWVKVDTDRVGVGSTTFVPPEVGYTYWVCLVARKDANSFAYSDEYASFKVPAITLNGATWSDSEISPDNDFATITYKLHDTNETTHVYCYWSEDESALEGEAPPSGDGVYMLDLGANTASALYSSTTFTVPATEGLVRNRTYYFRLAAGDDQGLKHFLSDEIVSLDTAETPLVVLTGASWSDNNVATVEFSATVGKLDPEQTELVALYSLTNNDVRANEPIKKVSVTCVGLGCCSELGLDAASSSATFPLWSSVVTNYYVRLALSTNVVVEKNGVVTTNRVIVSGSYSAATKEINVFHAIEENALIYIVTANPKVMCYGDAPQAIDYLLEYAGVTSGWGYENMYALTGALACDVSSTSPSGNYAIGQGTFDIADGGATKSHTDGETETFYYYKLAFSGATYTVTNAVFATAINDLTQIYSGEPCDVSALVCTTSGIRNEQPVTFLYRAGTNGWSSTMPSDYTDVGNYSVQFKATAPNHDDVRGMFKVTIEPAPLVATIDVVSNLTYTGEAQTPPIATNVTERVKPEFNPLTCEFRDEAGEWQSEMPSFTQPGTYKIFFRVSAPNHTTFVTNCTFTIAGWDYLINLDGATGCNTPINVSDPGWLIRHSVNGHSGQQLADRDTRLADLDTVCPNGLKFWQNYVIGRTNLSQKLIATIMQSGSRVNANSFIVRFAAMQALRNTGLDVNFRLDRKLKGESEFTLGALSDKYEMNVPLGPHDPTGLYLFNVVLAPTNELYAGQSVLSSITTVGVLRVTSSMTNTMLTVPWRSMAVDSETNMDVAVVDVVNPNGVSGGDTIHAYNEETGDFNAWTNDVDGTWVAVMTVSSRGVSSSSAEQTRLPLGGAFWLGRKAPMSSNGSTNYIYLIGRYTGEAGTVAIAEGNGETLTPTMVTNPTMEPVAINSLEWSGTPDTGDQILIPTDDRTPTILTWNGSNWGGVKTVVTRTASGRKRAETVRVTDYSIPPGRGFWYYRKASGGLSVTFPANPND